MNIEQLEVKLNRLKQIPDALEATESAEREFEAVRDPRVTFSSCEMRIDSATFFGLLERHRNGLLAEQEKLRLELGITE